MTSTVCTNTETFYYRGHPQHRSVNNVLHVVHGPGVSSTRMSLAFDEVSQNPRTLNVCGANTA